MPDDSAEIVFQSVLQDAVVSCCAMSEDVHSLTLSIQHFLCRPRRRPPLKAALKDDLGEGVVPSDMPESLAFQMTMV